MLSRLAFITSVLALAACSEGAFAPTGASSNKVIDDDTTVPQGLCDETTTGWDYRLIPMCVDGPPWPDNLLDVRLRHDYENLVVSAAGGGARGKGRLF